MTTNTNDRAALIAKLLSTAESLAAQGNEEAAATYTAKASALQLKYMIEDSEIRQAAGDKRADDPLVSHVVIGVEKRGGYVKARRDLVASLASIFHCKITMAHDRSSMTIYGYRSDVDFVQTIFTSLVTQMMRNMEHDARMMPAGESARTWRTSYAHGWAYRVVTRLRAARTAQECAAYTNTPGTAIVLRDRSQAVQDYYDELFAGRKMRAGYANRSIRSGDGHRRGDAAGARADLGGPRLGKGVRGQLN